MTLDDLCQICGLPFTPDEWDGRHSLRDGSDVHAACCPYCKESA